MIIILFNAYKTVGWESTMSISLKCSTNSAFQKVSEIKYRNLVRDYVTYQLNQVYDTKISDLILSYAFDNYHIEYMINENQCLVVVVRNWLTKRGIDSRILFQKLGDSQVKFECLDGSTADNARQHVAYTDDDIQGHSFSRYAVGARPWREFPELKYIKECIEFDTWGLLGSSVIINSSLIQKYINGDSVIGWHADRESSKLYNGFVATVSVGATRQFAFRKTGTTRIDRKTFLNDGDLCLMYGETQRLWQHCITKQAKAGVRYSLTYRHLGGPGV
jgi:alkylated DNA repair dioxygenase AlkB